MAKPGLPKKYAKMGFKKGWRAFKATKRATTQKRRSTRKGGVRKTARRAYVRKNNNPKRSNMKKSIPHPSVTGMASGLAIASYLNAGTPTTTKTGTSLGSVTVMGDGVVKDVTDGELGKAFNTLAGNAINMISSDQGRKTLVTASGIALIGAFARKQFPQLKLGGSKFYFRL